MLKSECRMPNAEGSPKPEARKELAAPTIILHPSEFALLLAALPRRRSGSCFGIRVSDFCSYVEIVEKARRGPQLLLELDENALRAEDVGHFAVGIEDVAELAGTDRANLEAGRIPTDSRALDAEMALFHYSLTPRPVAQVSHVRIDLLFRNRRLCKIEPPRPIGASGLAIAAADAPVVIDHRDAVG